MALLNLTSVCKTSRPASCIWESSTHHGRHTGRDSVRRDSGGPAGEVGEFNPALNVFSKGSKTLSGEAVSPVTLEASPLGGGVEGESPSAVPPPLHPANSDPWTLLTRHHHSPHPREASKPSRQAGPESTIPSLADLHWGLKKGPRSGPEHPQPVNQLPCTSPAATGLDQAKPIMTQPLR